MRRFMLGAGLALMTVFMTAGEAFARFTHG
jgi:hypothetical protein